MIIPRTQVIPLTEPVGCITPYQSWLLSSRQTISGKTVIKKILDGFIVGDAELDPRPKLLLCFSTQTNNLEIDGPKDCKIETVHVTEDLMQLKVLAAQIIFEFERVNREGYRVVGLVLDELVTNEYVESIVQRTEQLIGEVAERDRPEIERNTWSPINAFYRYLRGTFCKWGYCLIVHHPLDKRLNDVAYEDVLPPGWYNGTRTLAQEFDAEAMVYLSGPDEYTALRGKLRHVEVDFTEEVRVKL
jgi:hypothetical protein